MFAVVVGQPVHEPFKSANTLTSFYSHPSSGVSIVMHIVSISEYLSRIMKAVLLVLLLVFLYFVKAHISWYFVTLISNTTRLVRNSFR